jgi:hypothetical protein
LAQISLRMASTRKAFSAGCRPLMQPRLLVQRPVVPKSFSANLRVVGNTPTFAVAEESIMDDTHSVTDVGSVS